MYCRNCGAQINDDAVFCEKCGAKQTLIQAEKSVPKEESRVVKNVKKTPEEILLDYDGNVYAAARFLSDQDGISMSEAKKILAVAKKEASKEYRQSGDEIKERSKSSMTRILIIGCVLIAVLVIISAVSSQSKKTRLDAETVVATQKTSRTTTTTTTQPEEVDYTPTEPLYSFSGTGDDVITDISIENYAVVRATISGKHYSSIKAHGASDSYGIGDLLVNDIAPYTGENLLFPDDYTFEVNAQGSWTIEIFDMGFSTNDSFEGQGDTVTPVFTASSNVYEITTVGNQGYFSVKGYYGYGEYELLVNTTDGYSGRVYFPVKGDHACFVISGSRKFSIRPVEE